MWWRRGDRERQRNWRNNWPSCKTRSVRCRDRWIASSSCAASRPFPSAWTDMLRMPWQLLSFLRNIPKWESLSIHFTRLIRNTRSRKRQMKNGGGMISFIMKGGREAAVKSCRGHKDIYAGRVAGRRGITDRSPRCDDASLGGWLAIGC